MDLEKIDLSELNESQKKAVLAPLDPVLVVAGAGTGKTRVIIKRYEYLIKECNIDPSEILIVTFTQKATREIKTRVNDLFEGEPLKNYYISTFHKFCIGLIEEETGPFSICYVERGVSYIREAIFRRGSKLKAFKSVFNLITRLRWLEHVENRKFDEKDLLKIAKKVEPRSKPEKIIEKYNFFEIKEIYEEYLAIHDENQSLYFDDILFNADFLLNDEKIREKWDARIKAILFDEFQDIDPIQFRIISKLSKDIRNVFCVGDPDQSIYGFRHALPKSFEEFKKIFDDCKTFKLEINYRSTPEILSVSNSLINKERNNFSKNLTTNNPPGDKVRYFLTDSVEIQTEEILRTIQSLNENFGISYKNFAILFRNWKHSEEIKNEFLAKNVPFLSKDLTKLLQRKVIKDLFACLDIAFESKVKRSAKRVNKALARIINTPARGIPKEKRDELIREAKKNKMELIDYVLNRKANNYHEKCINVAHLIEKINKIALGKENEELSIKERVIEILKFWGLWNFWQDKKKQDDFKTAQAFLEAVFDDSISDYRIALRRVKIITQFSLEKDRILLTTIHGAKGLEFEYVFVISLNEGFLPSNYSIDDFENDPSCGSIDDERRLLYVALTRAKKGLYLISSRGEEYVSRFLKEIEGQLEKSTNLVGEILDSWDRDENEDDNNSWYSDEEGFQKDALNDENEDEDEEE